MPRRHNVKNQFEQLHHPRSFPYYLCISWQRNARTRQRVGDICPRLARHRPRITADTRCRFSDLSVGEQKKIQIAVALWQNPDLLAMDEPTNHVDAECRRQICKALAEYKGIGLLVSHDRALLDSLAKDCLCFESGHVTMRPGNYSQARSQANLERESAARAKSIARSEEKRMKAEYIRRVDNASRSAS